MQLDCPHCEKPNDIKLDQKVVCSSCKKELSNHRYRKSGKPVVSAISAVVIGVLGYRAIDKHLLEEVRYPLATEYAIVDACLSSYQKPVAYSIYGDKQKVCVCALEKTMEDVSYTAYQEDERAFLKTFKAKVPECL